jgi:glycosyltransferase involved in cell wall biosynthesis
LTGWVDIPTRQLIEQAALRPDFSATVLSDCDASRRQFSPRVEASPFSTRGKLDPAAIREFRGWIADGRFDVVHALGSRLLANALLAARGLKRAPAICGFMGHIRTRFSSWNPVHRLTYLHPRLAATSCNCQAAADPLALGGVPRERLFTIYAGHPFRERPTPPDLDVRRELGLPLDALVVGFAGNMRRVKGVDVLLKAAIDLQAERSIHWLLLGRVEDPEVAHLAARREIRDRVHLLGWRDDVERLMTAMDVFAMPSRSEGFSRAIMEAMELGLCPVATRVGGTPELIRDGVDGLLTARDDVAALAAAIRRLAHDEALRMSLAASARRRVKTMFTIDRMTEQTMVMYQAVLEEADGQGRARSSTSRSVA